MSAKIDNVLLKLLAEVNGATFISIDTLTHVDVNKKVAGTDQPNPHAGCVTKRITGCNVIVFQNKETHGYSAMVRRRLEAEGKDPNDFQLSSARWGTRVPNLPVVQHNGEYYLEVIVLHPGKVEWLLNGEVVEKSSIHGLRTYQKPEQGGLKNKVVLRRFAFSSIQTIRINNRTIHLRA